MNDVTQALRDFIPLFDDLGTNYAVMGGIAVRFYGIPRPTYDVDFIVAINRVQLPDLYCAAEAAGYSISEAFRSGWVDVVGGMPLVRLGLFIGENNIDVDLFLAESAYQHEILRRRRLGQLDDFDVWLASPEDVILLKLASFRPRDVSDIGDILFTQEQLDEAYMMYWADRMGTRSRLDQVLAESAM